MDLDEWSLRHLDRLAELESTWWTAAAGETLLHTDLRPDNMLLGSDGTVVVVDWACCSEVSGSRTCESPRQVSAAEPWPIRAERPRRSWTMGAGH
ncbi:phosphotransferase [Nocardia sp. GCM10030253]|uniref:phosphotransferase n=1 Tax=Nocardia sp. GCM10030253 TaxID=3273404 RepID=UPI00363486B0